MVKINLKNRHKQNDTIICKQKAIREVVTNQHTELSRRAVLPLQQYSSCLRLCPPSATIAQTSAAAVDSGWHGWSAWMADFIGVERSRKGSGSLSCCQITSVRSICTRRQRKAVTVLFLEIAARLPVRMPTTNNPFKFRGKSVTSYRAAEGEPTDLWW